MKKLILFSLIILNICFVFPQEKVNNFIVLKIENLVYCLKEKPMFDDFGRERKSLFAWERNKKECQKEIEYTLNNFFVYIGSMKIRRNWIDYRPLVILCNNRGQEKAEYIGESLFGKYRLFRYDRKSKPLLNIPEEIFIEHPTREDKKSFSKNIFVRIKK